MGSCNSPHNTPVVQFLIITNQDTKVAFRWAWKMFNQISSFSWIYGWILSRCSQSIYIYISWWWWWFMTWSSPKYRREKMIETVIPHYFSFGVYSKPICQAGLICCTWRPWRGLRRAAGSVIGLRIFLAVDGLNLGHPKCCSVQLQNWRLLNPKKMKSPYYIIIYIYYIFGYSWNGFKEHKITS